MPAVASGSAPRVAFVMEQTLGHVTHFKNLRTTIDPDPRIDAVWHPLTFAPRGTLETLPLIRSNWSLRASLRARRALTQDDRCRAVFFHTQVTALLSLHTLRRLPSVISLDATPRNYDTVGGAYGHRRATAPIEAVKAAFNRRSLLAARALITWCQWAKDSLIADYDVPASRITVLAPGVDLSDWPRPSPPTAAGPFRLLFVGADFTRKGGEQLLEAWSAGIGRPCELHLVTKERLPARPGLHVYNDITPNSDTLRRLYADAHAFVLPTQADCFPLVIQEAMAAGLPVISTNVGAIAEAVQPERTGVLIPPGNVRALRDALAALASDEGRRRALGLAGREQAERLYDSAANARRITELLLSFCGG